MRSMKHQESYACSWRDSHKLEGGSGKNFIQSSQISVFSGPSADTHPILYQVAAIAMPHGATPTSGDYRCVFFPSECAVNAESGCENPRLEGCFITDDGSWLLLLAKALRLVKFILAVICQNSSALTAAASHARPTFVRPLCMG